VQEINLKSNARGWVGQQTRMRRVWMVRGGVCGQYQHTFNFIDWAHKTENASQNKGKNNKRKLNNN